MSGLRVEHIEFHAHDFEPSSYSMPNGLLGVLRHERLELTLGPLMLEKGGACVAENASEFGPGIR